MTDDIVELNVELYKKVEKINELQEEYARLMNKHKQLSRIYKEKRIIDKYLKGVDKSLDTDSHPQ